MKIVKTDASPVFLILIILLLAGGIIFVIFAFRTDPIEEYLSGNQVINTLFIIEDQGKPLGTYVLIYYPETRRAASFDIPGSLGLLIQQVNRYDRIDLLYEPQRITQFQAAIEGLLGIRINYSVVMELENLVRITDLIEGVDIFIPIPVDTSYFIDDEMNIVLFPSGINRLDGDKARTYITYLLPDENMEMQAFRQQRFFLGLLKRLGEQNSSLNNRQVMQFFQTLIRTNMDTRTRSRLFDAFAQIDIDRVNIQSVGGLQREVSGQVLVFPHWEGNLIRDIVRQTINSLVMRAEHSMIDRVFTVEILNGTPTTGLAGRTADLFRSFGYDVISIGNADRNDHLHTVIIDRSGYPENANAFGEIINCRNIRSESPFPDDIDPEMDMDLRNFEYRADFVLILGRDFDERYVTGH